MTSTTLTTPFRIQVLFENGDDAQIEEFNTAKLAQPITFDVLCSHVFAMRYPNESKDQYNITFKYRLEEKHEDRWINFEDDEGLEYAFEGKQDKPFVYISAAIVKKGAAPPSMKKSPSVAPTATAGTGATTAATVSPKRAAKPAAKKPKAAKKATAAKHKSPSSKGSKVPMEQRILVALKELLSLGISTPPRSQVAMFAGTAASKSFANVLSKLSKSGLIEYPDKKTLRLTPAGIEKTGSVTPLSSNEQVHDKIRAMLKGTETKIFNQMVNGRTHSREQVANAIGLAPTKSFANCLSHMSTLGFLEYVKGDDGKSKSIRLAEIAFPLGRPNEQGSNMSVVSNEDVSTGF